MSNNSKHFNIQLNIQEVGERPAGTVTRGGQMVSTESRSIRPIEIKVSANTLESAVRKVKAYLDIEVEEAKE